MSAILSADDLNDFISPGVACIKPVETLPKEENSNPYEVTTEDKVQAQNPAPASISLTDCLACSGCVTSAEAVLVSLQSHTEVLNTLDAHPSFDDRQLHHVNDTSGTNGHPTIPSEAKVFVASVSPQVRASIAATYGISERRAGNLITQFLSGSQGLRLGGVHNSHFSYVLDTNSLREACLVLGADEVSAMLNDKSKPRPILTSACPGWICYAEKTHPHVLPHISALKSPQALTGTVVKTVISKALNIHPSQIWHLAIMPCFDKKLEASREELTDKWWSDGPAMSDQPAVRDVDCVITSRELLTLAQARGIQLSSLPQTPVPLSERTPFPDSKLSQFLFSTRPSRPTQSQSSEAGTSGGYLDHILHTYQSLHPGSVINTIRGRNADVVEYTLTDPSNPKQTPILKCARYYGFRNIQNLVRKLKPAKTSKLPGAAMRRLHGRAGAQESGSITEYAYVEVMACPGGCTNGGGQIKIEDVATIIPETRGEEIDPKDLNLPQSQKEWLTRIDEAYYSADTETDIEEEADNTPKRLNGIHTNGTNGTNHDNPDTPMTNTSPDPQTINGINTTQIHSILNHWSSLVNISLDKLAYTSYRKVESDVGKKKNLGDSERIAAIAGMSGGGW